LTAGTAVSVRLKVFLKFTGSTEIFATIQGWNWYDSVAAPGDNPLTGVNGCRNIERPDAFSPRVWSVPYPERNLFLSGF